MVYFVGAGPGATDLITVRGQKLLQKADVVIYAGSLVNGALLAEIKNACTVYSSACMTLEEVVAVMEQAEKNKEMTVRLHTGDPSIYGAIGEQIDALNKRNIPCEVVPGVSSFCGAAASLQLEYTLPGISQSLILTRMEGRTPVPEKEEISLLAAHGCSMVIFLSASLLAQLSQRLIAGGYRPADKAVIVYKATWEEEKVIWTTVSRLQEAGTRENINKTALVIVGRFLEGMAERSCLYSPFFSHEYRKGTGAEIH